MGSETFILVQGTKTQCCLYSFYPISYYHPWGRSWLDHGEVIYLGVTIDSHLTWVPHINSICKKVAPKIGALSRLRYILPYESLYTVYSSIILPSLNYCCTVWGHCSNSKLSKLQGYQNRDQINYFTSNLMFKCINSLAPHYLSNNIVMQDDITQRVTRSSNQLLVVPPGPNTEIFKQSFAYQGACLWNNLPLYVKQAPSLNQFKSRYKICMQH